MRPTFALIVLALAAQSVVHGRSVQVVPLTAADHRDIETLYGRTLRVTGANTGLRQWLTNLVVEPTPDGAVAWPYVVQGLGADRTAAALYRDRLTKGYDGWRIDGREEFPGTTMPQRVDYTAPPNESASTFTVRDYAEIKRIVTRYNLGYDNAAPYDGGRLTSLSFTPDALFQLPSGLPLLVGRVGILAFVKTQQATPGLHHWDSNFLIDVSPDGQVSSVNYDLTFNVNGDGTQVTLRGASLLTHRFVRSAEGWLIQYRRSDPVSAGPNLPWPAWSYGVTARDVAPEPDERRRRSRSSLVPATDVPVNSEDHRRRRSKDRFSEADYVEIEQLYARSNFAFDSAAEDGAAFARTFTRRGWLARDGVWTSGHRALARLAAAHPPTLHTWISNLVIAPDGDEATGRAYVLDATFGSPTSVNAKGRFTDTLIKTPEGWRFASRIFVSETSAVR
jgi:hypothetical protein